MSDEVRAWAEAMERLAALMDADRGELIARLDALDRALQDTTRQFQDLNRCLAALPATMRDAR